MAADLSIRPPLSPELYETAFKIMSASAFCSVVMQHIKEGTGISAIRMGDGERKIIAAYRDRTARIDGILTSEVWLKEYGILDYSLPALANELVEAGTRATFLGPSVIGLWVKQASEFTMWPARSLYIHAFYPQIWWFMGYVTSLLKSTKVMIICRRASYIADLLYKNHTLCEPVSYLELDSYRDHTNIYRMVGMSDAELILIAGGPVGKLFSVCLAEDYPDKVVLDVGSALMYYWTKPHQYEHHRCIPINGDSK